MKHIKRCLFFLGVLVGMVLIGFFGLIGIIGAYGVFVSLWEYCPNVLIGSGLVVMGILFANIGLDMFCKCMDKLINS